MVLGGFCFIRFYDCVWGIKANEEVCENCLLDQLSRYFHVTLITFSSNREKEEI